MISVKVYWERFQVFVSYKLHPLVYSWWALTAAIILVPPPCPSRYFFFQPNRTTAVSTEKPVRLAGNSHHGKPSISGRTMAKKMLQTAPSWSPKLHCSFLFGAPNMLEKQNTSTSWFQAKCPATITGGRIAILPGSSQRETSFNRWRDSKSSVALICMIPVKWEENSNHNLDMGECGHIYYTLYMTHVLKKNWTSDMKLVEKHVFCV